MEISSSHKLIRIQGNDAFTFLQGQLSNDLKLSNDSTFQKNALCNIKGRVISLIWIRRQEDSCFELYVDESLLEKTLQTLKKFKVFYKSEMSLPEKISEKINFVELGVWRKNCILSGLCEITNYTSETFTPHDLNYQNQNIINFDKGCYTGQEVVARMHYRAKLKSAMLLTESNALKNIEEGDNLYDSEKNIIGKLASKADIESLIFLKNKNLSLDQIYSEKGEEISISRQF
tara:strand:+ start:312 stop:1007 length:696 start_codon:yes stop_codon:yes gene_type:complete